MSEKSISKDRNEISVLSILHKPSLGAWYGGYVLDFRPGGPGSIPGVDVNMN